MSEVQKRCVGRVRRVRMRRVRGVEGERERVGMRVGLRWCMCGWHCTCVCLGLERKMVMGMRVEAKVSDSEAR